MFESPTKRWLPFPPSLRGGGLRLLRARGGRGLPVPPGGLPRLLGPGGGMRRLRGGLPRLPRLPRLRARRAPPVLGLDISSTAVKLLELSRNGGRYRVESFAVAPLPARVVVEKTVQDAEGVAVAIRAAVRDSGTRLRLAAAAVAGSSVITRRLEMPAGLSDEELETRIILDAGQHIPYPVEEVAMDFAVLDDSAPAAGSGAAGESGGANRQAAVLLAAARRGAVAARADAIEQAGLRAKIIDVESCALERACGLLPGQHGERRDEWIAGRRGAHPDEWPAGRYGEHPDAIPDDAALAVVDIGAATTALSVLSGGRAIYAREQLFGGGQLAAEIMRRYGIDAAAAEQARKRGDLPDDYETEVLAPFRDAAARQVARALQLFFSSSRYNDVDRIILAGGVAALPGLCEEVRERLGTPAAIADPFAAMAIAPKVNAAALRGCAPAMMTACGLALRSFD